LILQPGWPDYVRHAANVYHAVYEQAFKHLYKIGLIENLVEPDLDEQELTVHLRKVTETKTLPKGDFLPVNWPL